MANDRRALFRRQQYTAFAEGKGRDALRIRTIVKGFLVWRRW
jgi:hypothetical protein